MRASEISQWGSGSRWPALGQAAVAFGILALVLAIVGVGRSDRLDEAISYVASGGFGGLFLVVSGLMLRWSAQAREEWRDYGDIQTALSPRPTER